MSSAPPGARFPSNRALVKEHGVSPVTVQKAMRQLVALGLAETLPGVGTFVRAGRAPKVIDYGWQTDALGTSPLRLTDLPSTQRSFASGSIVLHSGYPARDLLPERLVRAALSRAARSDAAVHRASAEGHDELRAWFAQELASFAPAGVSPATARDVIVTAGSQAGLSSIFRAVVGQGGPLLIESPSYWGAILAADQAGVVLVPVRSGPEGPDPADLARAFQTSGARAFYAQPTFANPTGAHWSPSTARAVLEVTRDNGAFLIEDDWAHDFAIDSAPHPIASFDEEGRVIYLRSLTKSVSPALRVAAVIARGPARDRILADRSAEAMYVSGLLQTAALDVVTQPAWRSHVRQMRAQLGQRRDLLLESLAAHAPRVHIAQVPRGGLHLWGMLPEGTDVSRLVRDCETRGLAIAPGTEWFPAEPSGPFVRLNYSGENPERFGEAAQILAAALREQL